MSEMERPTVLNTLSWCWGDTGLSMRLRSRSSGCPQVTHRTGRKWAMSILTVFDLSSMTSDRYDEAVRGLEVAGQGKPQGRLHHVAGIKEDGSIIVVDVWDSAESLAAFGETMIPTLQEAGVSPVEPDVYPVHNVIAGSE